MTRASRERRGSARRGAQPTTRGQLALEAEILSLSSRGMLVGLPFAPAIGSRHLFSLNVNNRPLDVEGVVRNVSLKDEEGGEYHVGIEFTDLPRATEASLAQFVAKKLRSV